MTNRRSIPAASRTGARGRGHHSLAPPHLGEATAAATVAVVVAGVALVITGLGMVAMGLTLGTRYGVDPPPDAGSLTLLPLGLGAAILLLGAALTAGGVAVLGDVRRARIVTGILSAIAAALSAAGTILVSVNPPADVVLAIGLTVATLVFGVAAILLLRPRR
jgi:hypothetical protein